MGMQKKMLCASMISVHGQTREDRLWRMDIVCVCVCLPACVCVCIEKKTESVAHRRLQRRKASFFFFGSFSRQLLFVLVGLSLN